MRSRDLDRIKSIADFPTLVEYLREDLDWELEAEDVEDLVFEYEPEELGLDEAHKVKINEIKQLRPLAPNQPWGIFYLGFEPKRLPVVVLRRILRSLVPKKRASASNPQQAVWNLNDLLFISALGERGNRGISFAHFKENGQGPPQLQTFSWDARETHLHYLGLNLERLRWPEDTNNVKAWREQWSSAFTTTHRQVIRTSKDLSVELAKFARHTRELVREVYGYEAESGSLHRLHESFRTVLLQDLDADGFADMVAQTIAYGLFSARVTGEQVLGLAHLEDMVPNTNPFLKELFGEFTKLSGHEKHQIDFDELGVSELVDLLNKADISAILRDFGRQTGGGTEDPVIYFYEHFLDEYDKQQRVKRGEFYTPKAVVSYMVRSVDKLLREELDCPNGLADTSTMEWNGETWPKVMILDPATGTGTFLETVVEVIHETMTRKWKSEGMSQSQIHEAWNEYVPEHLLPRLYGFELMMAPYSVAHMKLGLRLKQTGYDFLSNERLQIYLTNTLEEPKDYSGQLFAEFLAHEAEAANRVKSDVPITVVIGNPPYALYSANLTPEARSLVDPFRSIDGVRIKERGALQLEKNLQDDYVKFFASACRYLTRTKRGVLSFISNHGYLDNVTLRAMRHALMQLFRHISVLDLHGNVSRAANQGQRDENVFDIQQGVSIGLFRHDEVAGGPRSNEYMELLGTRNEKYDYLLRNDFGSAEWEPVTPKAEFYLFVPQDVEREAEYQQGWALDDIAPQFSTGIVTARDSFTVSWSERETIAAVEKFVRVSVEEARESFDLGRDSNDWQVARAQADVRANMEQGITASEILYRPFDVRRTFYTGQARGFMCNPRLPVMQHMLSQTNLMLCTNRQVNKDFQHVLATNSLITDCTLSTATRERTYAFPLYLYPAGNLFDTDQEERKPNLAPQFVEAVAEALGLHFIQDGRGDLTETFGPEDVFNYAYAVFHSPTYRERYAEFLKRDFPRLPLTTDLTLFSELTQWGEELVSLHLMRSPYFDNPFTTFPMSGSNVMEKAKYAPEEDRVYINKEKQYFDNVPEETWNFRVGGYQVLDKWLKDRKGRVLSSEDIEHYRKVVAALHETRQIMQEVDEVIEAHGGWPLPGSVPAEAE